MPKISVVSVGGKLTPIPEANYCDYGDAAGDINGGDFWTHVQKLFPNGVKIKEIRIICDDNPVKVMSKEEQRNYQPPGH